MREVWQWCQDNGISQTALAKRLGVSTSLITEWKKGRRFPVADEVLHLKQMMARIQGALSNSAWRMP